MPPKKEYNPMKTFPSNKNRLLVLDWASIAYHQMFGMVSKKNTSIHMKIDNSEKELAVWRAGMIDKFIRYLKLFNPRDIVIALEGIDVWRNRIYDSYYGEHTTITYDKTGYFVKFDNFVYKVANQNGEITVDRLGKDDEYPDKEIELDKLSQKAQDAIKAIIPTYKGGNRKKQPWEFYTKKSDWRDYKDKYAREISKVIRSMPVGLREAEGDDVIYVATNHLGKKYDDVVLITGDSDMNQLLTQPNLHIYNHRSDALVECHSPVDYLEAKILAGDTSDNINGMALPGKRNQVGDGGAIKMLESVDNVFKKAEDEGWDSQYTRNRKLIDLGYIPTEIQRQLCDLLDEAENELGSFAEVYSIGLTDKLVDELTTMKSVGYYALNELSDIDNNPNIYRGTTFSSITYLHDEEHAPAFTPSSNRIFTNTPNTQLPIKKNWM